MTVRVLVVQGVLPAYREPFFARLQSTEGIAVEVWSDQKAVGGPSAVATDRFPTAHYPERSVGPFRSHRGFLRAAMSHEHDVLILPWNIRYLQLFPALIVCWLRNMPVILWGHGYSKQEGLVRRKLRNLAGRLGTVVVTYGYRACARLEADGFSSERVVVAPNAISSSAVDEARRYWSAHPERLLRLQRESGLCKSQTFCFVSRLVPEKRVDLLVRAFAKVVKEFPEAKLVIIGDGECREELESQSQTLLPRSNVIFVGALYEEMELAPWLMSSCAMTYPCNIGLSLNHAFLYGLPVVTSADPLRHNPEFEAMRSGVTGFTYADGDLDAYARAMCALVEEPERTRRMGLAARKVVTEEGGHSMDSMVTGMVQAITRARDFTH